MMIPSLTLSQIGKPQLWDTLQPLEMRLPSFILMTVHVGRTPHRLDEDHRQNHLKYSKPRNSDHTI